MYTIQFTQDIEEVYHILYNTKRVVLMCLLCLGKWHYHKDR